MNIYVIYIYIYIFHDECGTGMPPSDATSPTILATWKLV